MDETIITLALKCFDGDSEKAHALLKLLELSNCPEVTMPRATMILPEEDQE